MAQEVERCTRPEVLALATYFLDVAEGKEDAELLTGAATKISDNAVKGLACLTTKVNNLMVQSWVHKMPPVFGEEKTNEVKDKASKEMKAGAEEKQWVEKRGDQPLAEPNRPPPRRVNAVQNLELRQLRKVFLRRCADFVVGCMARDAGDGAERRVQRVVRPKAVQAQYTELAHKAWKKRELAQQISHASPPRVSPVSGDADASDEPDLEQMKAHLLGGPPRAPQRKDAPLPPPLPADVELRSRLDGTAGNVTAKARVEKKQKALAVLDKEPKEKRERIAAALLMQRPCEKKGGCK